MPIVCEDAGATHVPNMDICDTSGADMPYGPTMHVRTCRMVVDRNFRGENRQSLCVSFLITRIWYTFEMRKAEPSHRLLDYAQSSG